MFSLILILLATLSQPSTGGSDLIPVFDGRLTLENAKINETDVALLRKEVLRPAAQEILRRKMLGEVECPGRQS